MFILCALLLIQEKGVFGFNVGDLIVQSKEVMLEVLQLKKLLLQRGNDCILVLGFSLVKQASCGEITVHLLIEIGFRNYYSFEIKEQTLKLYHTLLDYPRRKDGNKGRKKGE